MRSTISPDDNTQQFAFDELGIRVPALLISPWVDAGVLDTVFDHTSLLKYLTDKWQLGPLGNRVPKANSFATALSIRRSPRTDCPEPLPLPDAKPIDANAPLNAHQVALAGFTHHLEINHTKPGMESIAAHSSAMAQGFLAQSEAVSRRIEEFLSRAISKV